ncbi:potassium/proton antiporter [Robiginitalea biformata]|uniref:Cell volume regulation protein CvrA n=1 Tax=Robiginitalea biformata (strain ATCC BAA-864 / DSM 15991 / KCTC 12146 / HTCC2501) TaxID=313596 RepID=A4CKH0_ROBBH|nr:potassium/proton antiporter [Robiginitalea biformata]EAR15369.1 cell volume regulation protein CvrA [Robiginitalea biformata HTCC2501]
MTITIENILLIGSLLLLISVIVGKPSYKFGVPTLLIFLAIGMLAGSEGIGGIYFDDPKIAQFIGIVSLNFILFSGGLDTNYEAVKPVLKEGLSLSTLGVLLTAGTLGTFVWLITDFTVYESMLLGSIVSSTDAAAVFSILRSKNLALRENLRPTLELESGSNDPMAYVLTIACLTLVMNQDQNILSILPFFFLQMILGGLAGWGFGRLSKMVVNRIRLDFEGLYPVLVIALMFITFSATDFVGGNGFLAIYICAVYLGNQDLIHKKTIMRMYDGLAWLMQIVLFLTLGLLVFPSEIVPVLGVGLLVSLFLILVARPVGVLISLSFFRMKMRRRLYISWVGLRGAAPIVFATYPLLAGMDKANMIFNIVFFISVTSVMIQGTTISTFAKWLNVALPDGSKILTPTDTFLADNPKAAMKEIEITPSCRSVDRKIVDLHFPGNAIIAMIHRDGTYLVPNGSTEIRAGDTLIVLSDTQDGLDQVDACLLRSEPAG